MPAPANQLIVFEILYENAGTVVSYARLYSLLRRPSSGGRYHLLQEYIRRNVEMLERNKLPYVIAVAKQTGYALCRVWPRCRGPAFHPRHHRPRAPVGKCCAKKYSDERSGATRISAVTVIDYFGPITNSLFGLDKYPSKIS
jgi:hypothetical protein